MAGDPATAISSKSTFILNASQKPRLYRNYVENQFEFCPDSQIGRREFRRRRTNLPCILRFDGRQLAGTLLDISEAGAKVASPTKYPNSPEGSLLVADREIPVRIVWEENGSIGVRFDDMPTEFINEIARKSGRD